MTRSEFDALRPVDLDRLGAVAMGWIEKPQPPHDGPQLKKGEFFMYVHGQPGYYVRHDAQKCSETGGLVYGVFAPTYDFADAFTLAERVREGMPPDCHLTLTSPRQGWWIATFQLPAYLEEKYGNSSIAGASAPIEALTRASLLAAASLGLGGLTLEGE